MYNPTESSLDTFYFVSDKTDHKKQGRPNDGHPKLQERSYEFTAAKKPPLICIWMALALVRICHLIRYKNKLNASRYKQEEICRMDMLW